MTVTYNERSWAIDVITEINLFLATKNWHFKSAGGESTIRTGSGSLFPDVLIYSDVAKTTILHGWELKMPDTSITDSAFISNAVLKANILNRNSFILWNAQTAVLYLKGGTGFSVAKTWPAIAIGDRTQVAPNTTLWKALLHTILTDLNTLIQTGSIDETVSVEILSIDAVIDVILNNVPGTIASITSQRTADSTFDAKANAWWLGSATEYGYDPNDDDDSKFKYETLSKVVLTDWVFKIVFANIIKRHFNDAREIERISGTITVSQAITIINSISDTCNFWNIFSKNLAQEFISDDAWKQIVQLNEFLVSLAIDTVDASILQSILQDTIVAAKRKTAGQFSTPVNLSDILVRLTVDNKNKVVLDPCCGTGTIINQAYKLKQEYGINQNDIVKTIWASDKYSFPIQLSTVTLTRPETIGSVLHIFNKDVIDLQVGQRIGFKDPNTGNTVNENLPSIDYVVSNLPFIKSKTIAELNPTITQVNAKIIAATGVKLSLSKKSDIFVYIPFYLHNLLSADGKIGLVLSNAWMGTEYGDIFLRLFQMYYTIQHVVVSGKGRWFQNAAVVTTLLIAKKRTVSSSVETTGSITFSTVNDNIEELANTTEVSSNIILGTSTDLVSTTVYSRQQIANLEAFGLPWCSFFANLSWISGVSGKLVKASTIFTFIRGERRGWNDLFYPEDGHGIEAEYIKPVVKNLRTTLGLISDTFIDAFCCSKSIADLTALGHNGALQWIRRFEKLTNGENVPLTLSLARPRMYWYEMSTKSMADFGANVNYGDSLFISKLQVRSFIDQRLIGMSVIPSTPALDSDFLHALLNSMLSMFLIESLGFGRGEGVLDLNKDKFERNFSMLNPATPNDEQKARILQAFLPLTQRDRLDLDDELLSADRVAFDTLLFEVYEISQFYEPVKKSLLHLYHIRSAVKN